MTTVQIVTVIILILGLWAALTLCFFRLIRAQEAISPAQDALQRAQESVHRKNLFLQVLRRHKRNLRTTLADIEAELVAERKKGTLALQLFAELVLRKNWLSSSTEVIYRVQVLLDGVTLGPQGVIASNRVRRVDVKAVNKKLDDLAKPFSDAGLAVSVKRLEAAK